MSIEKSYFLKDPHGQDYKPTIVPPGRYFCCHYPECKGMQVISCVSWDENNVPIGGELKPCPKCGSKIMFRW